jgi:predicted amidophosphoribosyltransferase
VLLPHLVADLADLVLARGCLACERLGPALCEACLARLRGHPTVLQVAAPIPAVVVAGRYDELPGRAVVAYKERGNRALAMPLGVLLADAVAGALGPATSCVLIPIPGHPRPARGFDALGGVVRWAVRSLDARGIDARVHRLLLTGSAYRPLKDLGRAERHREIAGAFVARVRDGLVDGHGPLTLVDDVVTSGATVTEATRTLATAGVRVDAIAAIAAASRDRWGPSPGPAPPRSPR